MTFLTQVKILIEFLGVECSNVSEPRIENAKSGLNTVSAYFWIQRNKENIIKFRDAVGFRLNKIKIDNLERCYRILKASLS